MFKVGDIVISYTKRYAVTNEDCVSEVCKIDGDQMKVKIIDDLCPEESAFTGRMIGDMYWVDQCEFVLYNGEEFDVSSVEQVDDFLS